VDALKNKHTLPIEQMEEKLAEIEKYYENLEKERIAAAIRAALALFSSKCCSGAAYP